MHLHRRVAPNKNKMQKCKRMFYTVGTTLCNVYVLIQYVDWKTLFCDSFIYRVLGVKKKSVSFSCLYFFSNRNIRRYLHKRPMLKALISKALHEWGSCHLSLSLSSSSQTAPAPPPRPSFGQRKFLCCITPPTLNPTYTST